MRRFAFDLILAAIGMVALALMIGAARAQSLPMTPQGPGWYYSYQPGNVGFNSAFQAKQDWPMQIFTVAALPACNSGTFGTWYMLSDATTPTYNGTPVGSGAVRVPVLCNGVSWTTH
jgi:hypothetical protein